MKLLRSFPMLAFTLILLSVAAVCVVQRSVGMLLVAGTLAAISWYITEGPRGRSLPKWVSNILVIAVSLNVLVDSIQNQGDLLGVLGRFAVWLTVIKLYERRRARDYAQLLTLSLLLMLTACLQSNDLLFGVMLLSYAALGLYVLLLYQMYCAFERERDARESAIPADYRLVPPLKPVTGPHVGWRFRFQAGGVAIAGILISLLIFVGFPRGYGAGMIGMMRLPPASRVTQFSWNIDLNAGGRITESREKVMNVQLRDERDRPVRLDGPVLLRGAALERYDGNGQWTPFTRSPRRLRTFAGDSNFIALSNEPQEQIPTITQHIILNRPGNGVHPLFSIYAPTAVRIENDVRFVYEPATQSIRTDDSARRLVAYSIRAAVEPSDAALTGLAGRTSQMIQSPWWSAEARQTLRELADRQLRAANVPVDPPEGVARWQWNQDAASALTRYLQSPEFMYTTDLSSVVYAGTGIDPIVRFLTETKRGHCEYFASALVALCHSKTIPARVIVGYVAFDYDQTLEQYNVLASNAHAWTEVATGERRWLTFDPTPPSILSSIHSTSATIADQVRWAYQRFEGNWSHSVVSFNSSAQSQLADTINRNWTNQFASTIDVVRDWMERVNRAFYFGPAGYIWMGIVAFALVIAVMALIKLMRRSITIRRTLHLQHMRGTEYQRMLRQLGFYVDMLRVLQRAGMGKPDWQPPLQFALSMTPVHREAAALVREITDVFYEARYGGQPLDRRTTQIARNLVQQLATALHVRA